MIGFLDDNKDLHQKVFSGKIVYSSSNLEKLIVSKNINLVFLLSLL